MTEVRVDEGGPAPPRLRRLPVSLEAIEIPTPCTVPWESLRGNERVRACHRCGKNVYNLSELKRAEAMRLISEHEGRVCLRIHRRPDGTVVTGDCWSRLRAARQRGLLPFVGVLVATAWIQLASGARGMLERAGIQSVEAGADAGMGKGKAGKPKPKKKEKEKPPTTKQRPIFPEGEPNMGAPLID
jgi:hypothetical protein